jgi:CelD/BcsL family acetyltransferase involved in cellulose biosynthesis
MQVYCFNNLDELSRYADGWDQLGGGMPFRGWTWLSTWWRHYGCKDFQTRGGTRLCVACVFDETDAMVGLAPWYLDRTAATGRVLRMLGSGEVCSDYLGVLCQRGMEEPVSWALADFLFENRECNSADALRWDLLEVTGIDAEDRVIDQFIEKAYQRGATVHCRQAASCWRIELPTSWDGYLAMVSKNRRRQIRRLEKNYIQNGRAVLRQVQRSKELPAALDMLIELHQRRRQSLNQPGCFASKRFTAFNREVVPAMFHKGQLHFYWLELDGKPVAAEYLLAGDGVLYAYQAGIDPEAIDHEPGKLINLLMLRQVIQQGFRALDFLRGDEPYKASFCAAPRPSLEMRIVPPHTSAQLRHGIWLAKNNMKRWIKQGLGIRD